MDEYLLKEGLGVWDEVMAGAYLRVLCIHESLTSNFLLLIYSNRKKKQYYESAVISAGLYVAHLDWPDSL